MNKNMIQFNFRVKSLIIICDSYLYSVGHLSTLYWTPFCTVWDIYIYNMGHLTK